MPGPHLLKSLDLTAHYELKRSEAAVCAVLGLILSGVLTWATGAITGLAGGYLLFSMLLVIVIDYRHLIIPDALSLPAIPLGIAAAVFTFPIPAADIIGNHVLAAAIGGGISFAVRHVYRRLRGVEGLGMGDVKLAAAAGAWVGLDYLAMTCLFATVAALSAVLVRRLAAGPSSMNLTTAIPFGSFIAPAIVIMWLFSVFTS